MQQLYGTGTGSSSNKEAQNFLTGKSQFAVIYTMYCTSISRSKKKKFAIFTENSRMSGIRPAGYPAKFVSGASPPFSRLQERQERQEQEEGELAKAKKTTKRRRKKKSDEDDELTQVKERKHVRKAPQHPKVKKLLAARKKGQQLNDDDLEEMVVKEEQEDEEDICVTNGNGVVAVKEEAEDEEEEEKVFPSFCKEEEHSSNRWSSLYCKSGFTC